jgi:hypothetical protein
MVTKAKRTPLKTAFQAFIELVKDIPTVRAVCVPVASVSEIVTVIDEVDDDVFEKMALAEIELLNRYLDIDIEFQTLCLRGQKLTDYDLGDLVVVVAPENGK